MHPPSSGARHEQVIKLAVFVSTTYPFKYAYMDELTAYPEGRVQSWIPVILAFCIDGQRNTHFQ